MIVPFAAGAAIDIGARNLRWTSVCRSSQWRISTSRPAGCALAVTIPSRHPLFPDVPTFAETMPGGFSLTTWFGVMMASGTAPALVEQLRAAIIRVQRTKDFQEATERDGSLVTITETQAALDALVRKEYELYKTLVQQSGAKVE